MKVKTTLQKLVSRSLSLMLVLSLALSWPAQCQLWPGDINDNGIVNNIDLLFWGASEGDRGPKRSERGTDWEAYDIADDWDDDYLIGLNYSQGDANGKGKIDWKDRNAILEDNYGLTHGIVTPDIFLSGDPNTDPILLLEAENAEVSPGETVTFNVIFGDATHPVDHYFGVAFTINWNPDHVTAETNNPWSPTVVDFDLKNGTWLNGSGNRSSKSYSYLREADGALDVVLLRKKLGQNSGHGEIAEINVILEDIVFLNDVDVNTIFTIDKIKLIDENMIEYPVAGSTEYVTINSNVQSLVAQEDEQAEEATTAEREVEANEETAEVNDLVIPAPIVAEDVMRVKLYPNPSADWLQIQGVEEAAKVQRINIYNQHGVLVLEGIGEQSAQQLVNIAALPTGNYYLHLITESGKSVMQFHKAAD